MTQQDKDQLKLEIDHIFESGANEIRIFEMVVNFIDSRNGVNKNFVLVDVSSLLMAERESTKEEIREWLIAEDFEGLAERL